MVQNYFNHVYVKLDLCLLNPNERELDKNLKLLLSWPYPKRKNLKSRVIIDLKYLKSEDELNIIFQKVFCLSKLCPCLVKLSYVDLLYNTFFLLKVELYIIFKNKCRLYWYFLSFIYLPSGIKLHIYNLTIHSCNIHVSFSSETTL